VKVAVIPVKVVEGPVDEVVDVVAVRDLGVPAPQVVLCRALHGSTGGRPPLVHLEDVLRHARVTG
jgi:hypothetical protein